MENQFSRNPGSKGLAAQTKFIFGISIVDNLWPTWFHRKSDLSVRNVPSLVLNGDFKCAVNFDLRNTFFDWNVLDANKICKKIHINILTGSESRFIENTFILLPNDFSHNSASSKPRIKHKSRRHKNSSYPHPSLVHGKKLILIFRPFRDGLKFQL